MNPARFLDAVVRPGLRFMADTLGNGRMESPEAELLLVAIALQESGARHRKQLSGPARGWWQFEQGGGFRGVREHARTAPLLRTLVEELGLPTDEPNQWLALPESELLQVCFARLLLWSDTGPLPVIGDKDAAWAMYLRNWRPGKPHRDRWDANYQAAFDLTKAGALPRRSNVVLGDLIGQIESLCRVLRREVA